MPKSDDDDAAISARSQSKTYTFSEVPPGTWPAIKSLVRRPRRQQLAVSALDLHVRRGEILGLLGPNGTGKTTTIKMLCGLVYPTSGELTVLGFEPSRRQFEFLRSISVIFGQKTMLWWDVSAYESLEFTDAFTTSRLRPSSRTSAVCLDCSRLSTYYTFQSASSPWVSGCAVSSCSPSCTNR